jgi:hypothetical protein
MREWWWAGRPVSVGARRVHPSHGLLSERRWVDSLLALPPPRLPPPFHYLHPPSFLFLSLPPVPFRTSGALENGLSLSFPLPPLGGAIPGRMSGARLKADPRALGFFGALFLFVAAAAPGGGG